MLHEDVGISDVCTVMQLEALHKALITNYDVNIFQTAVDNFSDMDAFYHHLSLLSYAV